MKVKIVILSLACLSCLITPSYGTLILAKAAAVKGAILGAGLLAKGALLKGGAILATEGLARGASLAAQGIALGAKEILREKMRDRIIARHRVLIEKPILVRTYTPPHLIPVEPVYYSESPRPSILNRLLGLVNIAKGAVLKKVEAVNEAVSEILDANEVKPPVVYEVHAPRFYPVPIVEKVENVKVLDCVKK